MESLDYLTTTELLGVELWRFIALTSAIFLGYTAGKIGAFLLMRWEMGMRDSREILAICLNSISQTLSFLGIVVGLRLGLLFIPMEAGVASVVLTVTQILLIIAIGFTFFKLVDVPYKIYLRWSAKTDSKLTDMLAPILRASMRIAVVVLTLVQVAQTLSDQPITSIIAGLGIGGLAIALAAQDSIKHIFGSFVIFTDRPFEVGDRLVIDGHDGPVESVGFRSTRIRTLEGHLVTIPNGELVNKNIHNISKRPFIRRILNVTITYDTPPDKVDRAVEVIKEILANHEGMREDMPPRVLFNDFNAASLNILVIYWYFPADFWAYMAFTERFNKELLRRFGEEGIDFAFPSQTLYLAGDRNRPLNVGIQDIDGKDIPNPTGRS